MELYLHWPRQHNLSLWSIVTVAKWLVCCLGGMGRPVAGFFERWVIQLKSGHFYGQPTSAACAKPLRAGVGVQGSTLGNVWNNGAILCIPVRLEGRCLSNFKVVFVILKVTFGLPTRIFDANWRVLRVYWGKIRHILELNVFPLFILSTRNINKIRSKYDLTSVHQLNHVGVRTPKSYIKWLDFILLTYCNACLYNIKGIGLDNFSIYIKRD